MSTIQETVQRLVAAHNDIKAALVSKGIDVSQSGFESFGNELRSIDSTPHCASVTGLGDESSTSQIYARALDFPTSFERVTRTINGVPNYFIKIPTMYRKILETSNGQITAFEMSTVGGAGFEPYPVFIDPETKKLLPYVLIGVYPFGSENGSPKPSSRWDLYGTGEIGTMRDLARSLGPGYRIYDVHFQKLFQDLALVIEQKVDFTDGTSPRFECMGISQLNMSTWVDGITKTDDNKWVYAMDPDKYISAPTTTTNGYSALTYAAPNGSGVVRSLGYDQSHPFINYPSSIENGGDYAEYYCDNCSCESGTHPTSSTVGFSSVDEHAEKRGLWECDATETGSSSRAARLCKIDTWDSDSVLFESTESFTMSTKNNQKNWDGSIYYSTDYSTWSEWDGVSAITASTDGRKYKVFMRGANNTYLIAHTYSSSQGYLPDANSGWSFTGSNIKCRGNLNMLLNYDGEITMGPCAFAYLFYGCANMDFNVMLPSTSLSAHCYHGMFSGCTSLTTAPALPATSLGVAACCYQGMFSGCTSLTTAPALPATSIANAGRCYSGMFANCTSLTTAPALPATSLGDYCYDSMFARCTSLTTIPKVSRRTPTYLHGSCRSMFDGCTSIKISKTSSEDYPNAYYIPTSYGVDMYANMFINTGGTFTGTPGADTTYYTSNTVIS